MRTWCGWNTRLVTEGLGVNHMRLVMGTSMGAMHTWMWGYMYPDFMDALMPLASAPGGDRRAQPHAAQDGDAIRSRNDPDFKAASTRQPLSGMMRREFALFMMTSSPLQLLKQYADARKGGCLFEQRFTGPRGTVARPERHALPYDCSRDYNPEPHLEKIKAPLYAVNSADDQVNPPELGILERRYQAG